MESKVQEKAIMNIFDRNSSTADLVLQPSYSELLYKSKNKQSAAAANSFTNIISNFKYLESQVKILSLEQQKSLIFRKNDLDSNFSHSKCEELKETYGESILNSVPIDIAAKLNTGFRSMGKIIGGSVTTGITINGSLTERTESLAWPQKHLAKHTVVNLAERSANSAHFCRRLQSWRRDSKHVIHYANMIIIDQVLNDDPLNSQYYEELLAVLLKNSSYLSSPPALLWLGLTGWGTVLRQQVQMTQAHGFPMYHIPDVFLKHPHNLTAAMEDAMTSNRLEGLVVENQYQEFFIKRIYKGDVHGHLGGFSHSVVASFTLPVIEYLSSYAFNKHHHQQQQRHGDSLLEDEGAVSMDRNPILTGGNTNGSIHPPMVPLFVPKRVAEIFLEADPYLFSANNIHARSYLRLLNGFTVATDQPGRAVGLLGYSVGNMFMLIIPDSAIAQNMKFGFLCISFLSSYDSMGVIEVAIAPRWNSSPLRNWILPSIQHCSKPDRKFTKWK
eukprot:gene29063-38117_t